LKGFHFPRRSQVRELLSNTSRIHTLLVISASSANSKSTARSAIFTASKTQGIRSTNLPSIRNRNPAHFVEAIVQGQAPVVGEGVHALQGKSFRISSKFQDFAATVVGVEGEKVSMQFSAAVLPNGGCAVIRYRAMALANRSNGQTSFIGFSETVNRGGFTVPAGTRIAQSVSARSGSARVVYYLIFSAVRGSRE